MLPQVNNVPGSAKKFTTMLEAELEAGVGPNHGVLRHTLKRQAFPAVFPKAVGDLTSSDSLSAVNRTTKFVN